MSPPYTIYLTVNDGFLIASFYPKLEPEDYEVLFQAVTTAMSREEAIKVVREFADRTGRIVAIA
jgi:hypothetical protein